LRSCYDVFQRHLPAIFRIEIDEGRVIISPRILAAQNLPLQFGDAIHARGAILHHGG